MVLYWGFWALEQHKKEKKKLSKYLTPQSILSRTTFNSCRLLEVLLHYFCTSTD